MPDHWKPHQAVLLPGLILRRAVREHNQVNIQPQIIEITLLLCINCGNRNDVGLNTNIQGFAGSGKRAVTRAAGSGTRAAAGGGTAAARGQTGHYSCCQKHCDRSLYPCFIFSTSLDLSIVYRKPCTKSF
mgnify:CR=1 FL=1